MSPDGTPPAAPRDPPLAYLDEEFLDSSSARPLRILAEYLQPFRAFHKTRVCDTVVFFGSARLGPTGPLARYHRDARDLAARVTRWSLERWPQGGRYLVCTGGGPGIMEAANQGALEAGGRTIGLNIGLPHEQRPNPYITPELAFEFHYFFMRKLWFAHLARAMVVFPGGFGTLDEMFEILTLAQTRKLDRAMPVLLYGSDYWNDVLDFDALVRHGTIDAADLGLFQRVDSPDQAMNVLRRVLVAEEDVPAPAFASSVTPAGTHPAQEAGSAPAPRAAPAELSRRRSRVPPGDQNR